ncbi:uncharacterized protein AB675_8128 [Cyphellophora attinorum]|uniref:Uncharacterized protein n=1 Tax=Cyphellophora attinorum TaxID=1664694 RepID=A0A0N1NYZ0_9EURO|nr:uncharacterized protein AB675_8128 [Phialophora attinorum]KPI41044.1 hypothetical protein AB675_8128 [Phialophora attinorum]
MSATAHTTDYALPQQPASFLLPNTNPIGVAANTSYNAGMTPYSRLNSQVWTDSNLLANTYSSHTGSETPRASFDPSVSEPGNSAQAGVPYPLNTNTASMSNSCASDRTLPRPGSQNYSSAQHSSAQENLPLSAVSHRSSVGWSTDSASNASHVSSQTSLTGGTPGANDYITDRSYMQRGYQGSKDLAYQYPSYDNSPQQAVPHNSLGAADELSLPCCSDATGARGMTATAITGVTENTSSTVRGSVQNRSQYERSETISTEATPLQPSSITSNLNEHGRRSDGYVSGDASNTNDNCNNPGDVSEPSAASSNEPAYATNPYSAAAGGPENVSSSRNSATSVSASPLPTSDNVSCSQTSSTATIEACTTMPESSGRHASTCHTHGGTGGDGYTTAAHLHPSSAFTGNALVIPSPHSQTRGAATSGMGTGRLTSVNPGLSMYASARGSAGSSTSMMSNLNYGIGTDISSEYHAGSSRYGHDVSNRLGLADNSNRAGDGVEYTADAYSQQDGRYGSTATASVSSRSRTMASSRRSTNDR